MLYKYRSLSNIQRTLDIFVNHRMYATDFQSLNDPMEGTYLYEPAYFSADIVREIYNEKTSYRLLSLSETYNNMLMWSYYAESHTGIVIGASVTDPQADVMPVNYVDDLTIDIDHDDVAKNILTKKLKIWAHEKEHRAFTQHQNFVAVEVQELIFGARADYETKELITHIADKFCPGIKISTITPDELDHGRIDTIDI